MLVSWGCFRKDGTFAAVDQVPAPEPLEKLFRHKVLRMLLDEEAIDEGVVANLLSWKHTAGCPLGRRVRRSRAPREGP
jgi:hypothetical protein